ncbi:DUF4186 family protein [Enhygromyxa salina]|uniref:DUF4186 family protein n=1 Tax=Enhygromyxa salina TaxID=215803 RepID=UPI000696C3AB|nr:DUF4186 family protein [Enhygromyxa salina]
MDDDDDVLKPLAIRCTDTDCENGLHCFLQKKLPKQPRPTGHCRDCGAGLVSWDRVRRRDIRDVQYTFDALKHELIRHAFFHRRFDQHAINHAKRKGRLGFDAAAEARIRSSVGSAKHPRQGRQTPYDKNVLHYAQHAVAACCRKCIEYWHGVPPDRDLSEEEIKYLTQLVLLYVDQRLPDLNPNPQKVPRIPNQWARKATSRKKR